MTRYESVRSAVLKWVGVDFLAVLGSEELCTKGTSSTPPIAMPATIPTVHRLSPLVL